MKKQGASIWFNEGVTPEQLNALSKNNMGEHLGIQFTRVGADFLQATMPVDHRTIQPYGLLHGGASLVLGETLGSVASAIAVDREKFRCVGVEINASHISSARSGLVTGSCRPVRLGRTLQVWQFEVRDEAEQLLSTGRLTVAIVPKRHRLNQAYRLASAPCE
jgi:1,4-dihydroxy-2-naphthoyl-CoA hydrolase